MPIWLMMGLAGLATFGARALFGVLPASWQLPPRAEALLAYLPAAAFAALAAPGLLGEGGPTPSLSASRVLAVVAAGYVAWRTRRMLLAICVGIVVFWLDLWVS